MKQITEGNHSQIRRLTLIFLAFLFPSIIIIFILYMQCYSSHVYAVEESPKNITVMIPKGSANPEVDITKLGPRQWYLPTQITVDSNTTVTWINNDTEVHTVTSGMGAGIESLFSNKRGTPNGLFDSGPFKTGQSWKHVFTRSGNYAYFCTIHPWMAGLVTVQGKSSIVPNYPVDASGNNISKMPIYHFTPDGKIEVGLSWDPKVLLTGKEISFFVNFFDSANKKPNLLPFDFVLMQDKKQLERVQSMAQVGMNVQHHVFANSGPVSIRIENIGAEQASSTEFNTTIFENPSMSLEAANHLAGQYKSQSTSPFRVSPLILVYITYFVIIGIPAASGTVYFLYRKGKI